MSLKMQYDDMGNFMNLNPIMFNVGCLGSMYHRVWWSISICIH